MMPYKHFMMTCLLIFRSCKGWPSFACFRTPTSILVRSMQPYFIRLIQYDDISTSVFLNNYRSNMVAALMLK